MTVIFKKKLYKLSAVERAIAEFKHLATFTVRQKGDGMAVDINNMDKEVKNILSDEYCNYVLYLMKI